MVIKFIKSLFSIRGKRKRIDNLIHKIQDRPLEIREHKTWVTKDLAVLEDACNKKRGLLRIKRNFHFITPNRQVKEIVEDLISRQQVGLRELNGLLSRSMAQIEEISKDLLPYDRDLKKLSQEMPSTIANY